MVVVRAGSACVQPHANGGGAGPGGAFATAKGGDATPHWTAVPQVMEHKRLHEFTPGFCTLTHLSMVKVAASADG